MTSPTKFPTIPTSAEQDERAVSYIEHAEILTEWDNINLWELIFANIGIGMIHALLDIAKAIRELRAYFESQRR